MNSMSFFLLILLLPLQKLSWFQMPCQSDLKLDWSHIWDSLSSDRISEFDWFVFVAYLSIWNVTDI